MSRSLYNRRSLLDKPLLQEKYLNPTHGMNRDLLWWYLFNEAAYYDSINQSPRGPHIAWDKTGRMPASIRNRRDNYPWTMMDGVLCAQTGFSNQYWSLPAISGIGDFTIIYSGYHNDSSSYRCSLGYGTGGASGTYVWFYGYHASFSKGYWCARMNGGTEISVQHTWTAGSKTIGACTRAGTTLTFYKNGVAIGTAGTSGSGSASFSPCYIGYNTDGQYGATQVITVQFYTRALTAAELLLHQITPYGTQDNPRLLSNIYRARYAQIASSADFMPTFSRILTMQGVHQ